MKLKKVISGGQTGADQVGVECAAALGLKTGGMMPRGFKTEVGPIPEWAKTYGLVEHFDTSYVLRTRQNARDADVTLWFGNIGSPGYYCTKKACKDYMKPMFENPDGQRMVELADMYAVWNVAGNRESTNPGVRDHVRAAFAAITELKRQEWAYTSGPGTLAGDEDL